MEEVNNSGQFFRALLENNDNIILLTDVKLTVLFRNFPITDITGWPEPEYKKISVIEYLHPEDKEKFVTILTEALGHPGNPVPASIGIKHIGLFRFHQPKAHTFQALQYQAGAGKHLIARDDGIHG